jgi:hypothetical protein
MNTHADKTPEHQSQSVSIERSQKQGGGDPSFQFIDNRPEAVAQRELQEMANNSPRVKQLIALQEMGGNVAQLKEIQVGFDGTDTQSMFAGPNDHLKTDGLGNCIAIVAFHAANPSQGAVMRHYDTINAFTDTKPDAISGGEALVFDAAKIRAVAQQTAEQLIAKVPAAKGNTRFVVALGGIWSNVEPDTSTWQSRFNLIKAIVAAVGFEPNIAAGTVRFDVATSTLS